MAKRPNLGQITSSVFTVSQLNAAYNKIDTAFDNTLSRDGSTPNTMLADLDMNSNDILNIGTIDGNQLNVNEAYIGGKLFTGTLTWRSDWLTATSYQELDLVKINGNVYVALEEHTSGVFATDLSGGKWELFVENATGPEGPAGADGPQGPAGQGVPAGGTAGQVLAKIDGTNYNTEWVNQSGGAGVTDGDKGDITVSASGATWTIDNGVVSLAKMANMATSSLIYRKTAGSGAPEVNTLATLKTDLGLTGTNSGDQTSIVGITGTKAQFDAAVTDGNFMYVGDAPTAHTHTAANITDFNEAAQDAVGAMVDSSLTYVDATPTLQRAALTGAITASAGSNTTSLGSFTKAQLDTAVSDGNVMYVGDAPTAHTHTLANITDVTISLANLNSLDDGVNSTLHFHNTDRDRANHTGTQLASTISDFNSAADARIGAASINDLSDVVLTAPSTGQVLKYNGTNWINDTDATGGGGGSPGGSTGEIQYNNAGAFAGAADVEIEGGQLRLPAIATPTAPAASGLKVYGAERPGGVWPAMKTPDGLEYDWTWNFMKDNVSFVQATYGTNTIFAMGAAATVISSITAKTYADTNVYTRSPGVEYLVTTPTTSAIAAFRFTVARFQVGGSAAGRGGFRSFQKGSPATGSDISTHRYFMGFWTATAPTDVNPSTLTNIFGIGYDSADTNVQFMHNDASGACTKVDLGASFPKPTTARSALYELEMYSPPGTTQEVHYRVTNISNGAVATGTITTNLPATSVNLTPHLWTSVGGTSSVVGINFNKIAVKSLTRV